MLAQAHKGLGDVAYRRGAHEDAFHCYIRVTEIAPDLGDDVYAKIGNIHYKKREIDAAVTAWKRALELNPDNSIVRGNLEIVADAAR